MTVKVLHDRYVNALGKKASFSKKGQWAFTTKSSGEPSDDELFFVEEALTLKTAAEMAAQYFDVEEIYVMEAKEKDDEEEMDDDDDDDKEYMKENVESAAKEIFGNLFSGAIKKNQDIDNFVKAVLKDNGVPTNQLSKVIAMVKQKGYKGDLLDNLNEGIDSSDFSDDVSALMEGESALSTQFKEKASTIFEAALARKTKEKTLWLEQKAEEYVELRLTEEKEQLVDKLNDYLDYAINEWIEQNELAIENAIRTEIAEEFMESLHNVFTEHYVTVPDEKRDLVEELSEKVDQLQAQMNESVEKNLSLVKENRELQKQALIQKTIDDNRMDLSISQQEKLRSLIEEIDFNGNIEQFEKKVELIENSYFSEKHTTANQSETLKESVEDSIKTLGENTEDPETKFVDPRMQSYLDAIESNSKFTQRTL